MTVVISHQFPAAAAVHGEANRPSATASADGACFSVTGMVGLAVARCALRWRAVVVLKRNAVLRLLWNEMQQRQHRAFVRWDPGLPLRALDHYVANPHTWVFGCDDERRWALPDFIHRAGRATNKLGIKWRVYERGASALLEMQSTYAPNVAVREMQLREGLDFYEIWCCDKLRQLMIEMPSSVMNFVAASSRPCLMIMRPTVQVL